MANFYAQITPTIERKAELVNMILTSQKYGKIIEEVNKTFGFYGVDISGLPKATGGMMHLGKTLVPNGRFLWNPNIFFFQTLISSCLDYTMVEHTEVTAYQTYQLTRDGISTFIKRPDLTIFTEYGEWWDKNDFLKMAFEYDDFDDEELDLGHVQIDENYTKELKRLGFSVRNGSPIFYNDGLMGLNMLCRTLSFISRLFLINSP